MFYEACKRQYILSILGAGLCGLLLGSSLWAQQMAAPKKRPNVLMIVADDMNWDSPGCFGGAAPDITPNIDRLASEGIRFWHAYVNISICTPSRAVMLTGLYPANNGTEGFQRIHPGTETLPAALNKAGFLCGIIGKPLRQQALFRWSVTYRWQGVGDEDLWGRDPAVYQRFAQDFFTMAKTSKQPFFLMANSHDPHDPWGGEKATRPHEERATASRTFSADEVRVPGFLPDLPVIRQELADYCTSVRRLDDMVGGILQELAKAQLTEDTIVVFLSDNGIAFPGAKFDCYPDSVRTPLIIRWPGKVEKNSIDREHMVAAVDFQATILDAVGLPVTPSDGRSFLPVLTGQTQSNRDCVFAQFYHIHGADALPMRSVLTKDLAYLFNPWSNGERRFGRLREKTFEAMQRVAQTDAKMAARIHHLVFRSVEEFYDLQADPGCLDNLLGPGRGERDLASTDKKKLDDLRAKLRTWMLHVEDSALHAFDNRQQPEVLERFLQDYRAKAAAAKEALKPYEKSVGFRF
jgi:N-sulfoglucosamine sulfohydrolase